ncbi:MAG: DUF4252 domain-containing protein [Bacteroidales bacterium]|jgi:hypothetical protein|nr:DUF4252 domain-containing protein [Bacteroidales bacterium]
MKKIIVSIFILILFGGTLSAQNSTVDKLFDKFSGQEGYTSVYISSYMFSMFSEVEYEDKEMDKLVNKLKSIKILAADNISTAQFQKDIIEKLPLTEYEQLMVVKEKGENVTFYINENNGLIIELLLITLGEEDNAIICIQGDIDLKNISKLSKSMKIESLEHLEDIDDEIEK